MLEQKSRVNNFDSNDPNGFEPLLLQYFQTEESFCKASRDQVKNQSQKWR